MKSYSVRKRIKAAPQVIWDLITDASSYPTWNPAGDGTSDFHMGEVYSGLMAPLITKSTPDMADSFEQFGNGVKDEAERRAG